MKRVCPKNCPIRAKRQMVAKLFDLKVEAHEEEERQEVRFTEVNHGEVKDSKH